MVHFFRFNSDVKVCVCRLAKPRANWCCHLAPKTEVTLKPAPLPSVIFAASLCTSSSSKDPCCLYQINTCLHVTLHLNQLCITEFLGYFFFTKWGSPSGPLRFRLKALSHSPQEISLGTPFCPGRFAQHREPLSGPAVTLEQSALRVNVSSYPSISVCVSLLSCVKSLYLLHLLLLCHVTGVDKSQIKYLTSPDPSAPSVFSPPGSLDILENFRPVFH